jgi:hypothetical protein
VDRLGQKERQGFLAYALRPDKNVGVMKTILLQSLPEGRQRLVVTYKVGFKRHV